MDKRYEVYALVDGHCHFYDTPDRLSADGPAQGWKIHVSATRENAERIAAIVWD